MKDYYLKYLKYKSKYLELKKQLGGAPPVWLNSFITNLFEVVPKLNSEFISAEEYPDTFYKIAGSAGTVLLTYQLNPELLNSLYEPNDIDIIAYNRAGDHIRNIAGRSPTKGREISNTYVKEGLISIDTINVVPTTRTLYAKYINVTVTHPTTGAELTVPVDTVSSIYGDYIENPITTGDIKESNYKKKIDVLKVMTNEMFTMSEVKFIRPRTMEAATGRRLFGDDEDEDDTIMPVPRIRRSLFTMED